MPGGSRQLSPLPGRRREHEAISELLAGGGGALVFHGDPGIGKTALLESAAGQADGFLVLALAAAETESTLPFAALHRLLGAVVENASGPPASQALALARLLESGPAGESRFATFVRLLRLLRRVAGERPLLCCVDDAHWLDPPSLEALAFVARRLRGDRIAMLFGWCDETVPVSFGVRGLRLAPLDDRSSREVLRDLVPVADVAGALGSIAMGSPCVLTDLARSLTPEQARGEAPLPQVLPPEHRLRRAHRARLLRLPADTRWLVLLAAADEELDVDGLAAAAAVSGVDIGALEPAESSGLLRVDGAAIRFVRPLVRAFTYHESTMVQRRSVHSLLARSVDPRTQPLRHYLHRALAAYGPDDGLATRLERAALASHGRHGAASRALERAAELTGDAAIAAARVVAAARHAWRAGEPHRARMLLRRVRPATVPARVRAVSAVLEAEIGLRTGAAAPDVDALLAVADELAGHDRGLAIGALARAGEALWVSGERSRYLDVARRALASRRPGEPPIVELACEHLATLSATLRGAHRRAADALGRTVTSVSTLDNAEAFTQAGLAAILCGAELEAHRLAGRGAAIARANRDLSVEPRALEIAALAELAMGRYDDPTTALRGLELARESGQEAVASGQSALLALHAAILGDRAACLRRARDAREAGWARAVVEWALAVLDLVDGRHPEAFARLRAATGAHVVLRVAATPHIVEAAARCGVRPAGVAALRVFDAWATTTANPRWLALSARCHALLAEDNGEADEYFRAALEQHARSGADLDRAWTALLYGQRLRRQRRPAAARVQLRGALDTFERLEARPWIDRTVAELRAAGHHVEHRQPPAVEALTPQQVQIARLVADGATNREVAAHLLLSTRTVDHHMRNIFAKLGVRSRVELARLMS
ncbi:LuxR family transcriptional regulator [Phytohabitans aurantiacus]|uniref:LuxR family transcriptional regulator n=1 Tax=Phytohabitans aurantiacus TaxID=3016789 RepID=UPI0024923061|nr:LuxR family transcriptional regulator [Phytohabitans aurantiacus]